VLNLDGGQPKTVAHPTPLLPIEDYQKKGLRGFMNLRFKIPENF
jgi:hypothetical protein